MKYNIEIKPKAIKDGKKIPKRTLELIVRKIELLGNGLSSEIKHLTNHTPEYRLRVRDLKDLRDAKNKEKDIADLSLSEAKKEWGLN